MRDYQIKLAKQTGGKAGTGRNKTSTVQVMYSSCVVKSFRFNVNDAESYQKARAKAEAYVKANENT